MFSDDAPLLNSCCMLDHRWLHPWTLTFSALAKFRLPSIFLQKRAAAKGELPEAVPRSGSGDRKQRHERQRIAGVPFSPRLRPSLTNGAEAIHGFVFWVGLYGR